MWGGYGIEPDHVYTGGEIPAGLICFDGSYDVASKRAGGGALLRLPNGMEHAISVGIDVALLGGPDRADDVIRRVAGYCALIAAVDKAREESVKVFRAYSSMRAYYDEFQLEDGEYAGYLLEDVLVKRLFKKTVNITRGHDLEFLIIPDEMPDGLNQATLLAEAAVNLPNHVTVGEHEEEGITVEYVAKLF